MLMKTDAGFRRVRSVAMMDEAAAGAADAAEIGEKLQRYNGVPPVRLYLDKHLNPLLLRLGRYTLRYFHSHSGTSGLGLGT